MLQWDMKGHFVYVIYAISTGVVANKIIREVILSMPVAKKSIKLTGNRSIIYIYFYLWHEREKSVL